MELAFSPDFPAWICYAVVLATGLFVARRKVTSLPALSGIDSPPVWYFWRTWQLVLLYTLVPILLFWVLDRSESIHDTSLFAALLVAIGYERLMSGKDTTVTVSDSLRSFWSPLQTYAEKVTTIIQRQMKQEDEQFNRRVLDCVMSDQQRMDKLKALAEQLAADPALLQQQITKVSGQGNATDYVRDRQTRIWYAEVTGSQTYNDDELRQRLLLEKGIIDKRLYRARPRNRSRWMAGGAWSLIAVIVASLFLAFDDPKQWSRYDLWRIGKSHSTNADVYRTRESLGQHLKDANMGAPTFRALAALLRDPALKIERADVVLALLLENRCAAEDHNIPLAIQLVDALKAQNIDARNRVHQALVYMAPPQRLTDDLRNWNPSAGDSLIELERRRDEWREFWRNLDGRPMCNQVWLKEPIRMVPVQPRQKVAPPDTEGGAP